MGADAKKTSTELVEAFLVPLPIRKIPGIGPKTEQKFLAVEVRKIEELRKLSRQELESLMGKWSSELYEKIWGRDESPILESYEIKSIGREETFLYDTRSLNFVVKRLEIMCEDVIKNFKEEGFASFRTVALTVRFADFETKTRSYTLYSPANSLVVLRHEAMKLLRPFFDARENPKGKLIRLIGIRIEKLQRLIIFSLKLCNYRCKL